MHRERTSRENRSCCDCWRPSFDNDVLTEYLNWVLKPLFCIKSCAVVSGKITVPLANVRAASVTKLDGEGLTLSLAKAEHELRLETART